MKKNRVVWLLVAVAVMFSVQNAYAWGKKKTAAPEEKTVQEEKVQVAPEKKVVEVKDVKPVKEVKPVQEKQVKNADAVKAEGAKSEEKVLREKVRAKLNNTSWDADIFPIAGGGKVQKDALIFSDNKFYAEQFSQKGFLATNYTLTIKDDGMTIWETMQGAENGQVIFWRGEINEDMTEMRGVLSKQKSPEESESFTFISKGKMPIAK